jgi:drug/metabolite transporter (DMT)-like permease
VSVTFGRTRYGLTGWLGQLLGITGALLLALARGARVADGQGEILAIVASVCYAAFSLTITVSRRTLSAILALFWMSLGSFGSFLLQELYLREPLGGYTPLAWFGLVGLGVLIQLLAWWLINSGLGQVPVALGALALGFQQVATPFLAAWLLGEVLRPLGLLGGTAIFAGILLVATGERRLSVIPAGRSGH